MEKPIAKINTLLKLVFEPKLLKALLSLRHKEYLVDTGWINSFKKNAPVDKNNNPIPWLTYPFIDFITPRLNKQMVIFEFGSGNSTLFYAKRVHHVYSAEHNLDWYNKLKSIVPENVHLYYKELRENGDYSRSALEVDASFDIIIVDGEDRNNCIINSFPSLKASGVIILDDSERTDYNIGTEFLLSKSFKRLDFWGISPGILFRRCTSVFYHPENSLGI